MSLRVWLYALALASSTLLPLIARAQTAPPAGLWKKENLNVTVRAYAVPDLLAQDQRGPCPAPEILCDPDQPAPASACCADKLIRLITGAVAPQTWQQNGGPGTIEYLPCANALLIRQTPDVQVKVSELLDSFRTEDEPQVAVEVRFIEVTEDLFERIGFDFERVVRGAEGDSKPQPMSLNDQQVHQLLEAVQGDRRTNVMQAPKVTTFSGQTASVCVGQTQYFVTGMDVSTVNGQKIFVPRNEPFQMGLTMHLRPTISADGRFVCVEFQSESRDVNTPVALMPVTTLVSPTNADGETRPPVPFTQFIQQPTFNVQRIDTRVCVPDGGTMLLSGGKAVRESRTETGTPVLSKIPYVNRMFKNVGIARENVSTLVLITPRIIRTEAEERAVCPAKSAPCCPQAGCCKEGGCCQSAAATKPACCATASAILSRPLTCEQLRVMPTPMSAPAPCCPGCPLSALIRPAGGMPIPVVPPAPALVMERVRVEQVPPLPAPPVMRVTGTVQVAPGCDLCVATGRMPDKRLAFYLESYHRACAAGLPDVAHELALRCLEIDPACFSDKK